MFDVRYSKQKRLWDSINLTMRDLTGINIKKWHLWYIFWHLKVLYRAAALVIICAAFTIYFIDMVRAVPWDCKLTAGTKSWENLPSAYVCIIERTLSQWDDLKRPRAAMELPKHNLQHSLPHQNRFLSYALSLSHTHAHSRVHQTVETPLAAPPGLTVQRMVAVCTLTNSRKTTGVAGLFHNHWGGESLWAKMTGLLLLQCLWSAKAVIFSCVPTGLLFHMGWSVRRMADHLSVCLCVSYHLSLSHLSFGPSLPHDQRSMYSVLYKAVPRPTGTANSFQQWRQRDRVRTHREQAGERA